MKLAIVSDTHGNWPLVRDAIRREADVDYLLFLGDHASDGRQLQQALGIPAFIVRGNCDACEDAPEEQLVELGGWKLLICHGHRYHVKQNLQSIYYRGLEAGADIVLFGHTHQAIYEAGAVTLINPGSVSSRNLALDTASWGLLTLSDKKEENFFIKYEKKACQND